MVHPLNSISRSSQQSTTPASFFFITEIERSHLQFSPSFFFSLQSPSVLLLVSPSLRTLSPGDRRGYDAFSFSSSRSFVPPTFCVVNFTVSFFLCCFFRPLPPPSHGGILVFFFVCHTFAGTALALRGGAPAESELILFFLCFGGIRSLSRSLLVFVVCRVESG